MSQVRGPKARNRLATRVLWSGMVLVGTRGRELVGMAGVRAWDWSRYALERLSLI